MGIKLGNNETKIKTGGQTRVELKDLFDLVEFPNTEYKTLRPLGEIVALGTHWFEVAGVYEKGEKKGQAFKYRTGRTCRNIKLDGTEDPNGKCGFCLVKHSPRIGYFQNFLDTELEETEPSKKFKPSADEIKTGFKVKDSKLWTPVAVLPMPPTVVETLQKLTLKNKDKDGTVRELSDKSFGRALDISKNTGKDVSPANMWSVQRAEEPMRKLTSTQRDYYMYDLRLLSKLIPTQKQSLEDMKYLVPQMIDKDYDNLNLEDFPELVAKRNKATGKKSSKSGKFSTDSDDDDDEDDYEKPVKKSAKKSRRVEEDDDEDEDELPVRKTKKSSSKTTSTKKKKKKGKSFDLSNVM